MTKPSGKVNLADFDNALTVREDMLNRISPSNILTKWTTLVMNKINPLNKELFSFTEGTLQSLIDELRTEQENVRVLFMDVLIDNSSIIDKQQYVQLHQALLIRLLDKLYAYQQNKIVTERIIELYNEVSRHLQNTLDFIEDFLSNYFDRNEKIPALYFTIYKEEVKKQLKKITLTLRKNDHVDKYLADGIIEFIHQFANIRSTNITYVELSYIKKLLNELLVDKALASTKSLRETLYYFNFNEDNFISYEYERLTSHLNNLSTNIEKINLLRFEQKNINQLSVKLDCTYLKFMPSLKKQINGWIDEEVKFLETEHLPVKINESNNEVENKVHTSLSVSKLALLIRLMVIDKIIINRTVAPMLRIIVKMFTTLQTENISFGSLETKYHAPDKATINTVKDILYKWIKILDKL